MTLYAGNSLTGAIYKGDQLICSSSEGSGGSGTTDVELTRISDDTGTEIGTWYMNFEDNNNNIYKVILIDGQYGSSGRTSYMMSNCTVAIGNLPTTYNLFENDKNWYTCKDSATYNTQTILDWCTANNYTAPACTFCRTKSFTINNVTYYGQLPNARELFEMLIKGRELDDLDSSTMSFYKLSSQVMCYSSTQRSANNFWAGFGGGLTFMMNNQTSPNTTLRSVVSILELPM